MWENIESGELHIVDYKSTAQMSKTLAPLGGSFIAPPEDPKQQITKLAIADRWRCINGYCGERASQLAILDIFCTSMGNT